MFGNNYLNLNNKEFDMPIYRIFKKKHFTELINEKKNVLVSPKLWDDPYENILLSKGVEVEVDGQPIEPGFMKNVYCQCWSMLGESDAMWRIYSHSNENVMIKSTPRKLLESLKKNNIFKDIKCFIGKVDYIDESEYQEYFDQFEIDDTDGSGIAKAMLCKRKAFKHEEEIRLIYSDNNEEIESELYSYEVNITDIIDELIMDPRMNESLLECYKTIIYEEGFNIDIIKSTLYQKKKIKINLKFN